MAADLDQSALNIPQWIETCKTAHGPFVFRAGRSQRLPQVPSWELNMFYTDGLLGALVDALKALQVSEISEPCPILNLTCAVCADVDCALEFGMRGGHIQLQRLLSKAAMLPQLQSDDVTHPMELLANAIGACSVSLPEGFSFPMSPTLPNAYEHAPSMFAFHGANPDLGAAGEQDDTQICLLVREEWSKRMESQADVGQVLWPAAEIMSRWAARTACHQWQERGYMSVLELGAGMGLTGLLIAHYMPRVVLTDFNPVVLRNLQYNAVLNTVHQGTAASKPVSQDTGTARALPSTFPSDHSVLVRRLDWSLPDSRDPPLANAERTPLDPLPAGTSGTQGSRVESTAWGADLHPELDACPPFDVIIGSDMICCREDAENVATAVSHWLAPGGTAFFMLPPARVRWGVQFFQPAAEARGLSVSTQVVHPSLVEDIVKRPTDASNMRDSSASGNGQLVLQAAEDGHAKVATGGGVYETELRVYTVQWK